MARGGRVPTDPKVGSRLPCNGLCRQGASHRQGGPTARRVARGRPLAPVPQQFGVLLRTRCGLWASRAGPGPRHRRSGPCHHQGL
eukprot:3749946-Lingulodinium_polyedra.AAC.1